MVLQLNYLTFIVQINPPVISLFYNSVYYD